MPLVGLGRVELPTSRLSGVRSNQLSYRPLGLLYAILAQKRATLLFCRSVMTVDLREGRVASVAKYACDLRSCRIVKDQTFDSSLKSQI